MSDVNVKARILNKNDTQANWNARPKFKPKKGQIIIYDIDETHFGPRIKIGDGLAYLIDLPFLNQDDTNKMLDHINNTAIHVSVTDRQSWIACDVDDNTLIFSTLD